MSLCISMSHIFIESAHWADSIIESRCPLYVCMYVCMFVPFHVVYFEAYFAPTSRSWMSKNFRDSESLGKSAGKKWSQNWTFLLGSGLKSPRTKKKFIFCWFSQHLGSKLGASTEQYLCWSTPFWPLVHSLLNLVTWSLPRPLIGHSTGGQNWMHQHNIFCVGALHFDPWCTLNLLSGQHKSHHHFQGLSLYWCYNLHRSRDSMSPVCGIFKHKDKHEHWFGECTLSSYIRSHKVSFFCWYCLTKHGGNHASRWIRDLWSKGILLILAYL